MNKLGFALLFAIGIGMVGTLTETQVMLHSVYAQSRCPPGWGEVMPINPNTPPPAKPICVKIT